MSLPLSHHHGENDHHHLVIVHPPTSSYLCHSFERAFMAACICDAVKAVVFGINVKAPHAVNVIFNTCGPITTTKYSSN
ncbi:hypothetical protein AAZX31_15G114200 [Glycine max]